MLNKENGTEMMIILAIGMGLLISAVCWYVIPLSIFIGRVENGSVCRQCSLAENCFAMKETKRGLSNRLSDWMFVSYLMIRRRCSSVEKVNLAVGAVSVLFGFIFFFILFWSKGMSVEGMLMGLAATALFFLSVVDWNTQYIPLECNIFIFVCGLIHLFADFSNWLEYLIGLIAVSGFLCMVNLIATPILRKKYQHEQEIDRVIGDGDIKLMAATGLLIGWKLNFLALGLGCITGSVIHVVLMKIKGSNRQFAFGPYLSLGVYITMICGKQLVSWYLNMVGINALLN